MHRILYISTTREPLGSSELEKILEVSRRNNRNADVTGLLVVGRRRFLQVLEGPVGAVRATYDRIQKDPRHFAMVKLNEAAIDGRSFAQWSMGFETGGTTADGATLEEQVAAIIEPLTDANLRAYFAGFARTHSSSQ